VKAVDGVSLDIGPDARWRWSANPVAARPRSARRSLRLIEPSGGSARLGDTDIGSLSGAALRAARASMQMVFQDPFASLNPRLRVGEIIEEGMRVAG
jgi:peptide/nickel transport system ATP-binding protein